MKYIAIILFLIPLFSFSQKEEEIYKNAEELFKNGKYSEAISLYGQLIELNQSNDMYYRGRGFSYKNKGRYEKAKEDYLTALSINDKAVNSYINLFEIYALLGNVESGLTYLRKGITECDSSGDLKIYFKRSNYYFYNSEPYNAIDDFEQIEKLIPDSVPDYVYGNKGYAYLQLKLYPLAIENFDKAIDMDPNNAQYVFAKAKTYVIKSKWDEALKFLNKSIELDSTNFQFYNYKGGVYLALKDFNKAIYNYTLSIKCDSSAYYSYLSRAEAYYSDENMDSSCIDYYKALDLMGENEKHEIETVKSMTDKFCDSSIADYYFQRGIAFYNLNKFDESVSFHNKGLAKFPNNPFLFKFKGNSLLASENFTEAIESFNKTISLVTEEDFKKMSEHTSKDVNKTNYFISTYFMLCDAYISLGKTDSAYRYIILLEDLISNVEPREGLFDMMSILSNKKGIYYILKNENGKALENFDRSIEDNPNNLGALYNRAFYYYSQNNTYKITSHTYTAQLSYNGISTGVYSQKIVKPELINKQELSRALRDCDKIIRLNKNSPKPFILRASVKKQLGYFDFCLDIIEAINLGEVSANEIAGTNCK
jgi:tetratricopeptide (TPR) repeat protein